MSSKKNLRVQLFVDPKVQGALVWRAVLYAFTCILAMILIVLCWRIVTGPARLFYHHFDDMWFFYGPALIAAVLLFPVVVIDMIRVSNRFAGPMLRLRRSMRSLARGEHVEPIRLRDKDFWHDFAEEFNAVVVRVQGEATGELAATGEPERGSRIATSSAKGVESVDEDEEDSYLATAGAEPPYPSHSAT